MLQLEYIYQTASSTACLRVLTHRICGSIGIRSRASGQSSGAGTTRIFCPYYKPAVHCESNAVFPGSIHEANLYPESRYHDAIDLSYSLNNFLFSRPLYIIVDEYAGPVP